MSFATYRAADGFVTSVCDMPLAEAPAITAPGQQWIAIPEGAQVTPDSHWIDDGELTPYGEAARARLRNPPMAPGFRWSPAAGNWLDERPLSALKLAKWERIKRWRRMAIDGGFTWDGSVFDSDSEGRMNISDGVLLAQTLMGMGLPASRDWTLADNTVRVLSGQEVVLVGITMGMHIDAAHGRARVLRAQLFADETDTPQKIEAISW